jgi:hypothetical protein
MPPSSSCHLPPWAPLHHEWYQGSLTLPGRYVLSLYHNLIVCFAKRITGFDWFFMEKSHFLHLWSPAPDATMFFLVHMIEMMAVCPCQEHYSLHYCSRGLSITRTVMFVVFFNEKSHSAVSLLFLISCHHSSSIFSCDDANNEMYDLLPSCCLHICLLLFYIIIM